MIDWEGLRDLHLEEIEGTYLNSAANGLISIANESFVSDESTKYRKAPSQYRTTFNTSAIPAIRKQAADLINANTSEIALIPNLSIGLNLFVKSLPDSFKCAFYKGDYPSLTMPFVVANFDVKFLEFDNHEVNLYDLELFLQTEKPDLLGLSQVQWLTGYKADLESIGMLCNQYGCLFLVDATQSLGASNIDVKKSYVDILGASGYKWPLAGFGNGILYIHEEVMQQYPPLSSGFNSFTLEGNTPVYYPSIQSYEPGHHDHIAFHRFGFALVQISELGLENIILRTRRLMSYLIQELNDTEIKVIGTFDINYRAGIICIKSKEGLLQHLTSKKIEVSERGENIRIGVHYYNNEADIDVFIKEVLLFIR
ncbi:aminotransferase class V-fold PLP-dependent enzyme [Bacteroidia bacterium]|nr:aminotransferase class V-fold PLP-dependent enzyme [Bacteroidia bacterium]MDB4107089.1 aminotransferase class V-fold PLP-dependent enzyme [Bacteroidia bacterium]MDB9882607.1 aminotransferase class V-fold PLP-dependent enzyme [Bacteroidia bacterium]